MLDYFNSRNLVKILKTNMSNHFVFYLYYELIRNYLCYVPFVAKEIL